MLSALIWNWWNSKSNLKKMWYYVIVVLIHNVYLVRKPFVWGQLLWEGKMACGKFVFIMKFPGI